LILIGVLLALLVIGLAAVFWGKGPATPGAAPATPPTPATTPPTTSSATLPTDPQHMKDFYDIVDKLAKENRTPTAEECKKLDELLSKIQADPKISSTRIDAAQKLFKVLGCG